MNCPICCETFTKSTRISIKCGFCDYNACRSCCQTYLLGESSPKCMNPKCGTQWSRKFLHDNFPKSFIVGPYKLHRENVLSERERALLPATQPHVETLMRKIQTANEIREIQDTIKQLKNRLLYLERREADQEEEQGIQGEIRERRQFIKPCGAPSCRGFLSTQWKCGMCETWACPDCHAIIGKSKDAPHTCDPNDVETAKMVEKETRPCPTCHVLIHKIDGCDQIWCTQCHTAFSYKSGAIETKVHNPHYYEWLRQTKGEVPRENHVDAVGGGCRRQLNRHETVRLIQNMGIEQKRIDDLTKMVRNIAHLREVELPKFVDNYENNNRDIRANYMMNKISEKEFKVLLQRAEKANNRRSEMRDVLELVATAGTDIIERVVHSSGDIQEIAALVSYANRMIMDIASVYGNSKPQEILGFTQKLRLRILDVNSLSL